MRTFFSLLFKILAIGIFLLTFFAAIKTIQNFGEMMEGTDGFVINFFGSLVVTFILFHGASWLWGKSRKIGRTSS